mmetsp:Transcript_5655/g.21895  ORF Transcript_5655/g.21895 Transcript_5655/m.21895 type:complete len:417 (-) Transcript_5655:1102-2352(-)
MPPRQAPSCRAPRTAATRQAWPRWWTASSMPGRPMAARSFSCAACRVTPLPTRACPPPRPGACAPTTARPANRGRAATCSTCSPGPSARRSTAAESRTGDASERHRCIAGASVAAGRGARLHADRVDRRDGHRCVAGLDRGAALFPVAATVQGDGAAELAQHHARCDRPVRGRQGSVSRVACRTGDRTLHPRDSRGSDCRQPRDLGGAAPAGRHAGERKGLGRSQRRRWPRGRRAPVCGLVRPGTRGASPTWRCCSWWPSPRPASRPWAGAGPRRRNGSVSGSWSSAAARSRGPLRAMPGPRRIRRPTTPRAGTICWRTVEASRPGIICGGSTPIHSPARPTGSWCRSRAGRAPSARCAAAQARPCCARRPRTQGRSGWPRTGCLPRGPMRPRAGRAPSWCQCRQRRRQTRAKPRA